MAEKKNEGHKIITQNKKAFHEYFVEEKYEAGIALAGTEVKSVRAGTVNLKDSYCSFDAGEIFVLGMHISPYEHGNIFNTDPLRKKKLLMHRREIMKLQGLVQQKDTPLCLSRSIFRAVTSRSSLVFAAEKSFMTSAKVTQSVKQTAILTDI